MKRIFVIIISLLSIGYLALCALLFVYQRSLIYHPVKDSLFSDSTFVLIDSESEKIRVLTRKTNSPKALIYFGGNADDVSVNLGSFAESISEPNLFLVNYRGYGGSTGSPSESALYADALAVFDHVRSQYSSVSVVGRSLGSGVAVYLASVRDVERLVLITPYDSIENVAKQHFPIFPIGLLLKDRFDSASRVKDISAKTLIILAESDQTIPAKNSQSLIAQFPEQQLIVRTLPRTTHNSVVYSNEYIPLMQDFLSF